MKNASTLQFHIGVHMCNQTLEKYIGRERKQQKKMLRHSIYHRIYFLIEFQQPKPMLNRNGDASISYTLGKKTSICLPVPHTLYLLKFNILL